MKFSKKELEKYNNCFIPESDLNDLENGLVGNFDVIDTYRHIFCDEFGITDLLRITFSDQSEIAIYAIHEEGSYVN